jgi:hypothetical protein
MPRASITLSMSTLALALLAAAIVACAGQAAPTATLVAPEPVVPTVAPAPTIVFLAGDRRLDAGACTTLEWQVAGALRTYLDGRGVDPTGTQEVCPTGTTTYTLGVVLDDGSETTRTQVVEVAAPTAAPTAVPTQPPAATRPPVSPVPAASATPVASPTSPVSVQFYPENQVYEIEKEDRCTAVAWNAAGVTDVQIEREGMGRKAVGAVGREEVCFGEREVRYFLYYKLPDGREERREVVIRRKG